MKLFLFQIVDPTWGNYVLGFQAIDRPLARTLVERHLALRGRVNTHTEIQDVELNQINVETNIPQE